MTGDRRLTEEEKQQFIKNERIFLSKLINENSEPSLYDVVLIELGGMIQAHSENIILLWKKIRELEMKLNELSKAEG